MSEEVQTPPADKHSGETEPSADLQLPAALVRTALSSEQTLMSWTRTSLSLFTFGFATTEFFHYLAGRQDETGISAGPRRLGIALICAGIVVLVLAVAEHVQRIRRVQERGLPRDAGSFLPIGSAAVLFAIGLVALVSVILGWHL